MPKIIGGTVSTSVPVPDWNQTNPKRADYIKNKPEVANALKGSAEGNPIRIDDASPLEHEMAVGLKSKNLCEDVSLNGATIMASGNSDYIREHLKASFPDSDTPVTVSIKFTAKDIVSSTNGNLIFCGVTFADGSVSYLTLVDTNNYTQGFGSFTVNEKIVDIAVSKHLRWTGGTITIDYIQVEEGTTATAFTPYVDVNGATLQRYGKNLCQKSSITSAENVIGSIILTNIKAHGSYTLSSDVTVFEDDEKTNRYSRISVTYTDGTSALKESEWVKGETIRDGKPRKVSVTLTTDPTKEIKDFQLSPINYTGATGNGTNNARADNIQFEFSATATDFEPYVEPTTYTADENGNVAGVTNVFPTTTLEAGDGIIIEAEYNRDANKVVADLEQKIATLSAAILNL